MGLPVSERVRPIRVVFVNWGGSDQNDIDVALRVVVTASEGAKQRDVYGSWLQVPRALAKLLEECVTEIRQYQNGACGQVLRNESYQDRGWCVVTLHDAELDKTRDDPSYVRERHAGEFGESAETEFLRGARKNGKDSTLRVGDDRLDGLAEVHAQSLLHTSHE